jgi:hypothetical protein
MEKNHFSEKSQPENHLFVILQVRKRGIMIKTSKGEERKK